MTIPANIGVLTQEITSIKNFWLQRNRKFWEWYEVLVLIDLLKSKGMETYVSNEPQTFYDMAHYLLTKGELSHTTPIENESALELDRRARVHRGCEYMWKTIDRDRQRAGSMPFVDELSFYLLVLGWYSYVILFDESQGTLRTQIWNPYNVYPRYANGRMSACVHSYRITTDEAEQKSEENSWLEPPSGNPMGIIDVNDYYHFDNEGIHNMVLLSGKDVTGWQERPDMDVLVSPVGGFPDRGSLSHSVLDWRTLAGRGIFEVNEQVYKSINKWKSMVTQILRDTAQPVTQEVSASPQATPEQLRERGALFHYAPGDAGLSRVAPPVIPLEVQAHLLDMKTEIQKGGFTDTVHSVVEGNMSDAGAYTLSLLATNSANQTLYPYMDAKHFAVSEADRFWLSKLKSSKRVFQIKGKFLEKLSPTDIPEDVSIEVKSKVATPRDWLQRGTIMNMLDKHLDEATLLTEIGEFEDPQAIKRRRHLDMLLESPEAMLAEKIASFHAHADYLAKVGDRRQSALFRRLAQAMEMQIGVPPPGQGSPTEMSRIQAQRKAGAPEERTRVSPEVASPESLQGYTPADMRRSIGTGSLRRVGT